LIAEASLVALKALYLIEIPQNIELVEKKLERRDAKRAEKRNWPVPLVVRVQRPSRVTRGTLTAGDGEHIIYSHQFEVTGHFRHYTKGSKVKCIICEGRTADGVPLCPRCKGTGMDPDKVKPCNRKDINTGEQTCPNGCRVEWCPPYWKGDPDAIIIPKTRKLMT
jgi:hypothetical protein